jgi:hypothetical protein
VNQEIGKEEEFDMLMRRGRGWLESAKAVGRRNPSHDANGEEAKDGDDNNFEDVDKWWYVSICVMQICVELRYVDLNYAICVCLLNYVMNLKYAMIILLLIGILILFIAICV